MGTTSSEGWTDEFMTLNDEMRKLSEKRAMQLPVNNPLLKIYLSYAAEAYHNMGVQFSNKAQSELAIEAYEKSMLINRQIGKEDEIAFTKIDMGKIYIHRGDYKYAVEILYDALRIFEKYKNFEGIGDVYLDLGFISAKQKKDEKAVYYFKKAYNIYKKENIKVRMSTALQYIAIGYQRYGKYAEAVKYYKLNIQLLSQMGENQQAYLQELLYSCMSLMHYQAGNIDSAIYYGKKNLEILQLSDNLMLQSSRNRSIGEFYLIKKDYKNALYYLTIAYNISKQTHNIEEESVASKRMSDLYQATGNYKKALELTNSYIIMKDSVQQKEDEKHVLEQQFKYEFEKKELLAQIEQKKKINGIKLEKEIESSRKNTWLVILTAFLLLISTGAYFLHSYYKQKNIIEKQKSNLLKQQLLVSQMNPHFIFNSLNAIQNYIFKKSAREASNYLGQFADMMRMILDFSRKDYITLESEIKFLENYLQMQQRRLDHQFDYSIKADVGDTHQILVPPMLAQPFIENAIEHGIYHKKENGKIEIIFRHYKNKLEYIIEDDGVGFVARPEKKSNHESLAIKITKERMDVLFNNSEKDIAINIIDKKTINTLLHGVKVSFVIPYKEL